MRTVLGPNHVRVLVPLGEWRRVTVSVGPGQDQFADRSPLDMENIQEQARFLFHDGGDTTINLIPAFSAYLLGVAGNPGDIFFLTNEGMNLQPSPSWALRWSTRTCCPRGLPLDTSPRTPTPPVGHLQPQMKLKTVFLSTNNLSVQDITTQQQQYFNPASIVQQQQYYQPTATGQQQQQQYYQPQPVQQQQYQAEYYQQQQQYGQTFDPSLAEKQVCRSSLFSVPQVVQSVADGWLDREDRCEIIKQE